MTGEENLAEYKTDQVKGKVQGLACGEGDCATARVAGALETIIVAATEASRRLEGIASAAHGPLWFQLYVYRRRSVTEHLVQRAQAAGYRALVLPRTGGR